MGAIAEVVGKVRKAGMDEIRQGWELEAHEVRPELFATYGLYSLRLIRGR